MNVTRTLSISLLAVAAYSLIRKNVAAGTLLFYPDKLYQLKFDGLTPVLIFGMRVQNTSNQNFTVNSFAADVLCENTVVGNASAFYAQVIQKNSQMILRVECRLMLIGLATEIVNAVVNKDYQVQLTIRGNANVDGLQVPLNLKYTVGYASNSGTTEE